jgi:hypothetical protein
MRWEKRTSSDLPFDSIRDPITVCVFMISNSSPVSGPAFRKIWFTVRARVKPVDIDASQQMLLQLMDPRADTSVAAAILADETLGGRVAYANPEGPSGVIVYTPLGNEGYLIGCEWRTRILL